MIRRLIGATLAATVSAAPACAPLARGAGAATPEADEPRVRLEVENANWLDVDVFAVRGGALIRVGLVTAKTSETFQLPDVLRRYSGDLRFLVDPVGSSAAYLSDAVRVAPGDLVELRVGARLEQSSIIVR